MHHRCRRRCRCRLIHHNSVVVSVSDHLYSSSPPPTQSMTATSRTRLLERALPHTHPLERAIDHLTKCTNVLGTEQLQLELDFRAQTHAYTFCVHAAARSIDRDLNKIVRAHARNAHTSGVRAACYATIVLTNPLSRVVSLSLSLFHSLAASLSLSLSFSLYHDS